MTELTTQQRQDLEQLKAVIYERVPRLNKRSFGCEVELLDPRDGTRGIILGTHAEGKHDAYIQTNGVNAKWIPFRATAIIGHLIRLNHVLESIGNDLIHAYFHPDDGLLIKTNYGEFCWSLDWDTLDEACEANPELAPFLLSILRDVK